MRPRGQTQLPQLVWISRVSQMRTSYPHKLRKLCLTLRVAHHGREECSESGEHAVIVVIFDDRLVERSRLQERTAGAQADGARAPRFALDAREAAERLDVGGAEERAPLWASD